MSHISQPVLSPGPSRRWISNTFDVLSHTGKDYAYLPLPCEDREVVSNTFD